jgi:hypothetical protein
MKVAKLGAHDATITASQLLKAGVTIALIKALAGFALAVAAAYFPVTFNSDFLSDQLINAHGSF